MSTRKKKQEDAPSLDELFKLQRDILQSVQSINSRLIALESNGSNVHKDDNNSDASDSDSSTEALIKANTITASEPEDDEGMFISGSSVNSKMTENQRRNIY